MPSNFLFPFFLLTSLTVISYLVWWSLQGEYSGLYAHLYGYTTSDKLALLAAIILLLIILISLLKVWREKKYLTFLISPILITLLWVQFFDSGIEILRITGCFESICSDISIKNNGTFWLIRSSQNDCFRYDGNYIVKGGVIHLYDTPTFESYEQLEVITEIKNQACIKVSAQDFELWGGCFSILD